MSFFYQLTRPFAYLSVKGPTLDLYRFWGPLTLSLLSVAVVYYLPASINSVGSDSLSSYLVQFFATLPGFYVAALAAIVAFQGGDLDKEMPGTSAIISANRDTSRVNITFRLFLCYLFSYLTVLSIIGFGICVVGSLLVPSIEKTFASSPQYFDRLEIGYVFLVACVTFGVVCCTVQGLYFLAERVHQTLIGESD